MIAWEERVAAPPQDRPAPELMSLATRIVQGAGYPDAERVAVRDELVEHLLDATDAERCKGVPEDVALARAREQFGDPRHVGRRLLRQRLWNDWRIARDVPQALWWFILADVAVAVVWSGFQLVPEKPTIASRAYVMGLVAVLVSAEYWWGVVAVRFGLRALYRFVRCGAPLDVGALGITLSFTAVALFVVCRPGATSMVVCGADVSAGTCAAAWYPLGILSLLLATVAGTVVALRPR